MGVVGLGAARSEEQGFGQKVKHFNEIIYFVPPVWFSNSAVFTKVSVLMLVLQSTKSPP